MASRFATTQQQTDPSRRRSPLATASSFCSRPPASPMAFLGVFLLLLLCFASALPFFLPFWGPPGRGVLRCESARHPNGVPTPSPPLATSTLVPAASLASEQTRRQRPAECSLRSAWGVVLVRGGGSPSAIASARALAKMCKPALGCGGRFWHVTMWQCTENVIVYADDRRFEKDLRRPHPGAAYLAMDRCRRRGGPSIRTRARVLAHVR